MSYKGRTFTFPIHFDNVENKLDDIHLQKVRNGYLKDKFSPERRRRPSTKSPSQKEVVTGGHWRAADQSSIKRPFLQTAIPSSNPGRDH